VKEVFVTLGLQEDSDKENDINLYCSSELRLTKSQSTVTDLNAKVSNFGASENNSRKGCSFYKKFNGFIKIYI
jgi:hypothetical protein